jgi:dolichol-phosphate mannosyltransferase
MSQGVREYTATSTGKPAERRADDLFGVQQESGALSRSRVTVVVPAKNEEATLAEVLADLKRDFDDILVVDGHSRDRTVAIATAAGARVISDTGRGKGDAIRCAIDHVSREVTVFFDADGSHAREDIDHVVAPILRGEADLVIASRMRGGSDELHGTPSEAVRLIGSTLITQFINARFGVQLTDYQNGFRAVRTSALKRLGLREDITTIEQEMAMRALALGLRVSEVPSHEYSRRGGTSKINVLKVGHKYVWQVLRDSFMHEGRDSVPPCPVCDSNTRERLCALGGGVDLLECRSCGLVHVWPFPDAGKLAELYAGDYFERRGGLGGYVDYEASSDLKRRSCERLLSKVEGMASGGGESSTSAPPTACSSTSRPAAGGERRASSRTNARRARRGERGTRSFAGRSPARSTSSRATSIW